jgi:hypothetical protein
LRSTAAPVPVDLGPSAERGHDDIVPGRFGLSVGGELGGDLLDDLLVQRALEPLDLGVGVGQLGAQIGVFGAQTGDLVESAALGSGRAVTNPTRMSSSSRSPSIKCSTSLSPGRVFTASPRRSSASLIALFASLAVDDILSRVRHSPFGPAHFVISSRVTLSIGSRLRTSAFLPGSVAGRGPGRSASAVARLRARIRSAVFLTGALPDSTASLSSDVPCSSTTFAESIAVSGTPATLAASAFPIASFEAIERLGLPTARVASLAATSAI